MIQRTDSNLSLCEPGQESSLPSSHDARDNAVRHQLCGLGWRFLVGRLESMLDEADDRLFAIAGKADGRLQQSLCRDASRTVRRQRQTFIKTWRELWTEASNGKARRLEVNPPQGVPASLVRSDIEEEDEALRAICLRAGLRLTAPLAEVAPCLSAVLRDGENPLTPAALCQMHREALASFGLSLDMQLMMFELFDRYVLGDLAKLCADSKVVFVRAGMLRAGRKSPMVYPELRLAN